MDKFLIDSHKLGYHPQRVSAWCGGKDIYPIYIEIGPTNSCNHRCIFCALDYLGYKPQFLDRQKTKKFIADIARRGVKSIMFGGEGEPLLHKDLPEFVTCAKARGLDVAITTNGVLCDKTFLQSVLGKLSWLRISMDAASPKTYASIHGTSARDFDKLITNIKTMVGLKKKYNYDCTLGVQFLLLNQNAAELDALARMLKKIGLDYLIVKPYSQHPQSINRLGRGINYGKFLHLEQSLRKYSTSNFQVIFRTRTMRKQKENVPYTRCLGLSFWSYLSAAGDLYACSSFLGDVKFCYGNVYKESFNQIWKGKKRQRILNMMQKHDIDDCRHNCRLDEINRYLWGLKNPPQHVNFI